MFELLTSLPCNVDIIYQPNQNKSSWEKKSLCMFSVRNVKTILEISSEDLTDYLDDL